MLTTSVLPSSLLNVGLWYVLTMVHVSVITCLCYTPALLHMYPGEKLPYLHQTGDSAPQLLAAPLGHMFERGMFWALLL